MTEAMHTPGPWFSPDRRGTRYVEARIGGGMLQEVAACGPTERPEQQAANARLIASAPELLDALLLAYKALDAIGDDMTVGERYTNAGQHLLDALQPARAAIAKATGEQA
jgi:hypothetical protein